VPMLMGFGECNAEAAAIRLLVPCDAIGGVGVVAALMGATQVLRPVRWVTGRHRGAWTQLRSHLNAWANKSGTSLSFDLSSVHRCFGPLVKVGVVSQGGTGGRSRVTRASVEASIHEDPARSCDIRAC